MIKNKIIKSGLTAGVLFNSLLLAGCGSDSEEPASTDTNQKPTVTISGDSQVQETKTLTITAEAFDPDGTIASYAWKVKSGPDTVLAGANTNEVTITAPEVEENTSLELALTVTDDKGAATTRDVTVTIMRKVSAVTITGLVTDGIIANARLVITIGGELGTRFESQADAEGKYSAIIEVDDSLSDALVQIRAFGDPAINPEVEFVSLLPSLNTLTERAGDDGILDSEESFGVNVTNVSTAEFILLERASEGQTIESEEQLAQLLDEVDSEDKLELAAIIKIVVDNDDFKLPEGVESTLELIATEETAQDYVTAVNDGNPDLIAKTVEEIKVDETLVIDADNDGYVDAEDAFPADPLEWFDTDGDGIGNNADDDDDGDGVTDPADSFPLNKNETVDTDGDGIGNNADDDDDGDGVADAADSFPLNKSETVDTDGDGTGNKADDDDDGDGVADAADSFPLNKNETVDTDGDGTGNNADTDDDGDGVADAADSFPLNKNETVDTDGDGIGNNADDDDDGDGVADAADTFPLNKNETVDTDGDGVGDNSDVFPTDPNEWLDADGDGVGDNSDPDASNPDVTFSGLADELSFGPVFNFSDDLGPDDLAYIYEEIRFDSQAANTSFALYQYEPSSLTFKLIDDIYDDELLLTADGWQPYAEDHQLIQRKSDGSAVFENSQGDKTLVAGQLIDITAKHIASLIEQYGSQDLFGWSLNLDPQAAFDLDARLYEVGFTSLSSSYRIWSDSSCGEQTSPEQLCNFTHLANSQSAHPQGALTSLDQLFVAQPWNGVNDYELHTVHVGGDYPHELRGELIASDSDTGVVNLYVSNYDQSNAPRLLSVQATWTRITIHGEELVTLEVPEPVIGLVGFEFDRDDTKRLFALIDNIVRDGDYSLTGDIEDSTDLWMNQSAFDQVLAAFSNGDTDGDAIVDAIDSDDDNDGIPDEQDSFPRNELEWLDSDGDGIGNNSDTDDDNDGVADGDDLAPLDDQIGAALPLTTANLAPGYIEIFRSSVIETSIAMGYLSGGTFHFDSDNTGYSIDAWGREDFSWSLADNALVNHQTNPETETNWYSVDELVAKEVITAQAADQYSVNYGSSSVEVAVTDISSQFQLLEAGESSDRFWVVDTISVQIADVGQRELLLGSAEATAVLAKEQGREQAFEHLASLAQIAFTPEQIVGQWALPITLGGYGGVEADLVTFAADGSAQSELRAESFSWQINGDGNLVVTNQNLDSAVTVTYQQVEQFGTGIGVYTSLSDGNESYSGYGFVLKAADNIPAFNLQDQFLMSSFILSNSDAYDEDGNIKLAEYFGFNLKTGGGAYRTYGSRLIDGIEPEVWSWQQVNGRIELSANRSNGISGYVDCDISSDQCNKDRRRFWQPLAQVGERLYVLEWSERNNNGTQFPSVAEDWVGAIPARVNFYQVHLLVLDTDGDGLNNELDLDDDNDGVTDSQDAFVQDNREWLDFDGDGIGNNADQDDDNDSVVDWEDAFPFDAAESADTDGDGLGNNSDLDDDGDGIADIDDLAPLDDAIRQAISFTSANLASEYINIVRGKLTNPGLRMGWSSGESYVFDSAGAGSMVNEEASNGFNWILDNDSLVMSLNEPESRVDWLNLNELVELGVVTLEIATEFIGNSDLDSWGFDVTVEPLSRQWQLLDDGTDVDRFWSLETQAINFVNDWDRESLLGSIDAEAIEVVRAGSVTELTDLASMSILPLTNEEVIGQWALQMGLDPTNETAWNRFGADLATFNADFTGFSKIYAENFDWTIDNDGVLVVTMADSGAELRYSRYENYTTGIGVRTEATLGEQNYTSFDLAVKLNGTPSITPFIDQFVMNSFTMTNPDAFDENGQALAEQYFGFRLQTGGTVTRVHSGDLNIQNPKDGWRYGIWTQETDNSITIQALYSNDEGSFANCDPVSNAQCNYYRRRHWQPLEVIGNRLYVLEWEEHNDNAFTFLSEANWHIGIKPRVQFYQLHELDSDHDGEIDALDWDIDNDGFSNEDDAFPFDPQEQHDSDGDGVGDNLDSFPFDSSETFDTDGDGLGNNADPDDDNDGILDADDETPLVYTDVLLGSLTFTEPAIETCVYNSYDEMSLVRDITNLSCPELEVTSLNDLSQLENLNTLYMWQAQIGNWSSISAVSQLMSLQLDYGNFTGFSNLASLENLTQLRFFHHDDTVIDTAGLSTLTSLTSLDISGMVLDDWSVLSNLSNLNRLSITRENGQLSLDDWSFLPELTQLEHLSVLNTNFNDLSLIAELDLRSLQIGEGHSLGGLGWSDSVSVGNFQPERKVINNWETLLSWPNLTQVQFNNTDFSDLSLLSLNNITELAVNNTLISDWSALTNWSEHLYRLDVANTGFSDLSLISGAQLNFLNLQNLEIFNWEELLNINVNRYLLLDSSNFSELNYVTHNTELHLIGIEDTEVKDLSPLFGKLDNLGYALIGGLTLTDPSQVDTLIEQGVDVRGSIIINTDNDNDGFSNDMEQLANTDINDPTSYPVAVEVSSGYLASFETDLSDFITDWQLDSTFATDGSVSLRSVDIGDDQQTSVYLRANLAETAELTFDIKVDSESCCDQFTLFIDGEATIEGVTGDWQNIAVTIEQGIHLIEWQYHKDGSVSDGEDAVWLDNIRFTAN